MKVMFIITAMVIILLFLLFIYALCKASSIINRKEENAQWEDDMWRYGDEKTEDWD